MSFFDFFKSKEERERENLLEKIKSKVFPNGDKQIEKEVEYALSLLNYKYSRDTVFKVYLHSCITFFLSDNKSKDEVVNRILIKWDSVLDREDAGLLFDFIRQRNMILEGGGTSNYINSKSIDVQLFMVAKGGIVELKQRYENERLSLGGRFEVLLLNSFLVVNKIILYYGENSNVQDDYFRQLIISSIRDYGITDDPQKAIEFINKRMSFYMDELRKLQTEKSYTPLAIQYSFYQNPLWTELKMTRSPNITDLIEFYKCLGNMIDWVERNAEKYINQSI